MTERHECDVRGAAPGDPCPCPCHSNVPARVCRPARSGPLTDADRAAIESVLADVHRVLVHGRPEPTS